jgi:hypothetical protein
MSVQEKAHINISKTNIQVKIKVVEAVGLYLGGNLIGKITKDVDNAPPRSGTAKATSTAVAGSRGLN